MRALVQRVASAAVSVDGEVIGAIGGGLCVLVGVGVGDDAGVATRTAERLWRLRIFEDDDGRTNRSAADLGAEVLVVSQFTLYADTTRGRRPSFVGAAAPEVAAPVVDALVAALRDRAAVVATGRFGAHMQLQLVNDGPFTVMLDG